MPRPRKNQQNDMLLQAALEGLELQRRKIEENIAHVRSLLGAAGDERRSPAPRTVNTKADTASNGRRKRAPLSEAAKKRIAAAQKRRWAEYRKRVSAGSTE